MDVVRIGDRIHISTALLQQIHERPGHWSEVLELVGIQVEANGAKVLVLQRCREERGVDGTVNGRLADE